MLKSAIMTKKAIQAVKGTRDYYPEEMAVRTWLYERARAVSESFGYQEYDAPYLESFELYAARSSIEIVEKQSYVFEDRSGERITLRPELTPSLARMVAARQNQLTFPLRWWSFGPFWRYERPQKGRSREFFQWNIDMIGEASPEGDAEMVAIAATFLKQVGFQPNEVKILVNNRRLVDEQTTALGITPDMRLPVYRLVDRRDKLSAEAWQASAKELELTAKQMDGLVRMIEDKDLWKKSPEMERLMASVQSFGVKDYVEFAPHVIRGFDYYTGTVMEAWDTAGDFRALFGGGRYDNLVGDVGGEPVSAVGFAVGLLPMTLILEHLGRLPKTGQTPAQVLVTVFDEASLQVSIALANELRNAGIKAANYLTPEKLGKQFKYADRIGARLAVVLGPDEAAQGKVTIKDLTSGEQETVERKKMTAAIRERLERSTAS